MAQKLTTRLDRLEYAPPPLHDHAVADAAAAINETRPGTGEALVYGSGAAAALSDETFRGL